MLTTSLTDSGFRAIPLDYCPEQHAHVQHNPAELRAEYDKFVECAEWPIVSDRSYIIRLPSLIVDGKKES